MNYIGDKVIFQELPQHEYVHIQIVDGIYLTISDGGELRIPTGKRWSNEAGTTVVRYDTPVKWNFVYENKNPGLKPAAYKRDHPGLPEMFPNVEKPQ